MQKTVLISLPIEDLQTVIIDCVNACLNHTKHSPTQNEQPVNTKELCAFLGVTEPTIIRWRKKGKIPFLQIGSSIRFNLSAVVSALEVKKKIKG